LKPKLKTVPSGDWYCSDCKPKERVRSPKKTVRRVFSSTEEDDTEEDEDSGQVKEEDSEEEEEDDEDFQAGLRIRIHIIRIRIQHFWLNTDPDPGLK
jgi:bromodomain adjacent to zinc finger domain protein 1A